MNADFYAQHHSFSTRSRTHIETTHTLHGYQCDGCGCGSSFPIGEGVRADVQECIDAGTCPDCGSAIRYATVHHHSRYQRCRADGCDVAGEQRFSLGLPAGHWCDRHYETRFPYRRDGADRFDPADAGERYDAE